MISSLLGLFSLYVHPFEKNAEKFFLWVTSYRDRQEIEKRLHALMQENLLVLTVWLEKRFKNYHYLTKKHRKELYSNAVLIERDFEMHRAANTVMGAEIQGELTQLGLRFDHDDLEKIQYIKAIMMYLDPHSRFSYREGSTFGKLLRDPAREKLVGDCNQIVTLYAYIFSRRFDIRNLQIKLIPGHVCLHFKGIDIEATRGRFANYKDYDYIAPITELVSTNILDISDPDEAVSKVPPDLFVKASQLAIAISGKKEIVEHNLEVAYHNLGLAAVRSQDFERAVFYLEKCKNKKPLASAYHNACVFFLKNKNFQKAHFYADKRGDPELKKAVYGREYNALAKTVKGAKTIAEAKRYQSTYRRMLDLAYKMGDQKIVANIQGILDRM
ncbi:MAG: hypothetical protein AAB592_00650 [Patescibacteria group bacterium]